MRLAALPTRTTPRVPRLESGDRLTRYEFERRYRAMPYVKKAELVEGVVYMPSPVSASHSKYHGDVVTWLGTYASATPRLVRHDNATVRLDLDNEVQPDAFLQVDSEAGGQSRVDEDGYIDGAPELVAEVALSSAAYDLHDKLQAYRRNGVQEYVVLQLLEERLDWFWLDEGEYKSLLPDGAGVTRSRAFPGLWLDAGALIAGDLARVLAVLREGLESAEHAAFVEELGRA